MKKTTPQKITKRLTRYGALSAAIVGVADASGQVGGPTVVNADIVALTPYELNMDGDTVVDFKLIINSTNYLFASAFAANAEILGSSSTNGANTYYLPYALNSSAAISNSATGNWFNASYQSMNVASCAYGNWCSIGGGVTNKFLGLRFNIGANQHYGWAKLNVEKNAGNGVTLIEYYYNPNPNEGIQSGKTLDINEDKFSKIRVVVLNKTIALFNLPQETNYRLFNLSGQNILNGKINTNIHTIEANSVSSGIYIIVLEDANSKAVLRKKIIL